MDTGSISGSSSQAIALQYEARISVSAKDQLKAVMATLLEGIAATPLPDGKGQRLNITA